MELPLQINCMDVEVVNRILTLLGVFYDKTLRSKTFDKPLLMYKMYTDIGHGGT